MRWRKNDGERGWFPKIHIFGVCLICLLCSTNVDWAVSKFFYEDGTIQEGEIYSYVGVYDAATVDMTGGEVTRGLAAYDTSTVNISGGFIHALGGQENGRFNLSGTMEGDILELMDTSTVNMIGGTLGSIEVYNSSSGTLCGGTISDYLLAKATVNIYGYGFAYDAGAGAHGGGQLTGFWGNGAPFGIDLYSFYNVPGAGTLDTWSHIVLNEIPEPCTLALLAFGAIIRLRRK